MKIPTINNLFKYAADDSTGGGSPPKEMMQMKDPVTNEEVTIPKELESFFNHTISGTRGKIKTELQEKYQSLMQEVETKLKEKENENSEILQQLTKMKEQDMTAEERAKEQLKRLMQDNEKKLDTTAKERDNWKNLYFQHKITSDIYTSFGDVGLCNPEQTAYLFQKEGRAEIREKLNNLGEKTGEWETMMSIFIKDKDGNSQELTGSPAELFQKWINQPHNAHHLANNLRPGGGSQYGGDSSKIDPAMLQGMNPVEKLKLARNKN